MGIFTSVLFCYGNLGVINADNQVQDIIVEPSIEENQDLGITDQNNAEVNSSETSDETNIDITSESTENP